MVTTWPTPIIVDRAAAATSANTKIYVVPYQALINQAPSEVVNHTTELVREKIKQSKDIILQNGPLVIPKEVFWQPSISDKDLKRADKLLQDGEEKYRQLRFDEAVSSLSAALDNYERSLALISDFKPVAQTLLMLAVCYFREDREDRAKAYLTKRILLNPTLELDPEQYPALFRTLVYSVRSTLTVSSRGELEILANTDGATIYLNGRKAGVAPVILKNLLPGDYYLRVHKQGLQPWAGKVTVASSRRETARALLGGVARETGPLADITEAVRANVLSRTTLNKIQAYGKSLKANFMVVGGVQKTGDNYNVSSLLIRIADKHVCALPTIQLNSEVVGANSEVHDLVTAIERQVAKCSEPLRSQKITVVQPLKTRKPESKSTMLIPTSDSPAHTETQPNPRLATTTTLTNSTAHLAAIPVDKPAVTNLAIAPNATVNKLTGPNAQRSPQPVNPASPTKAKTTDGTLAKLNVHTPLVLKAQELEKTSPADDKNKTDERWYESWWFLSIVSAVVVTGCLAGMAAGGVFNR
jgi:tetratricopeptide (TPR) repeat protein